MKRKEREGNGLREREFESGGVGVILEGVDLG
jgi:hypothetical protein